MRQWLLVSLTILILSTLSSHLYIHKVHASSDYEVHNLHKSNGFEEKLLALTRFLRSGGVAIPVWGQDVIPEEIDGVKLESWSFLLICNPAWFLSENREKILALYQQFMAFGRAIGAKHIAIWFWKDLAHYHTKYTGQEVIRYKDGPNIWVTLAINDQRNAEYCAQYRLLPSESPHVLVTTTYPGPLPSRSNPLKNQAVIKLNEADQTETTLLLAKLADQILIEGLNQQVVDSKQYWQSWVRIYRTAVQNVRSLIDKATFGINTTFFKAEVKGKEVSKP